MRLPLIPRPGGRLLAVVAALASLFAAVGPATPAHAAVGDLTCNVNVQLSFSPALTLTQTTTNVTGVANVVNCISLDGAYPDLTAGTVTNAVGTATSLAGVPCSLLITITGTATIDWTDGQQTTFDFTVNTNPLNGLVSLMTTQTSGPLAGTISETVGAANPNLDCVLTGLTSLSVPIGQTTFL
jgi:hypothetical protein